MKSATEYQRFNRAVDTIFKARPGVVKRAMELEQEDRAKRRKIRSVPAVRVPRKATE